MAPAAPPDPERVDGAAPTARGRFTWRTLRILRPGNALTTTVAVLVGAYLATRPGATPDPASFAPAAFAPAAFAPAAFAPAVPLVPLALAAVAAFAFAAAGNVRNDVEDIVTDRLAHPDRPLVRGELSVPSANALAAALYGASLLAAWLLSPLAFGLVLLALPLMEGYERLWKRRGLPGNLTVALLTAAPFLLGALATAPRDMAGLAAAPFAALLTAPADALRDAGVVLNAAVLSTAGLAALATAGREVLKDIEDADADAAHRRTLPHRVGARRAAAVAAAFLVLAVLLSPLPWLLETVLGVAYIPAVAVADACFGAAAATGFRRPGLAQRLAKVGMLVALAALVIGRAQAGDLV